jgi:HSP90 family molecular chaperone
MLSKMIKKQFSKFFSNLRHNSVTINHQSTNNFISINKIQKNTFSTETKTDSNVVDVSGETEFVQTNKSNLGFKAETKKILDIVTHSLYTDKEIFLRELLSNCSDALEKQRYFEVQGKLPMTGEPLFISITTNDKSRTITLFDSGVGMTREEMIENLGTIAKSGTQNFVKAIQESRDSSNNESLIGQFGVGFYSSFIVGEYVEVISRPQNSSKAHLWVSDGNGEFTISDVENCDFNRGTKVIIHLKVLIH